MEFEIKNKKLTDDEFYKIREEILSTWETGKEVNLQEAIDYQKSIPEHKSFSKKLLKAKEALQTKFVKPLVILKVKWIILRSFLPKRLTLL